MAPAIGLDHDAVTRALSAAGCIAPSEEAKELIEAGGGNQDLLAELVGRRSRGEPVAWLTGRTTFCGYEVVVAPGVYVPRPQTEPLALRAAASLPPGGIAADLCTGSGAVALVMARAQPAARVLGTEIDAAAARCARRNGVEVLEGFLDDPLPPDLDGRIDVITAVTPYVPTDAIALLPRDVQAFEPRLALDGGPNGTELLAEVARRAARRLAPGGALLLELGGDQATAIATLLADLEFEDLDVMTDEDGADRAICARRSGRGPA